MKTNTNTVTCLGITFSCEEERRAYFREELRKQLPELRKLEGFPIGEDEDIINLSDPPFYTACPNPWLNDFVALWEEEKKQIEGKKERKSFFNVHEPYASDVSEGKNNPIYNAHAYHTKVPHPAIMRYILHYTQPGDVIFDGFAGTGMTGVAAYLCGRPDPELKFKIESEFKENGHPHVSWGERKAICGDLSPIASFIAYNYTSPIDLIKFENEASRILKEVETEYASLFSTKHSDGENGIINFIIFSDVFLCNTCQKEIVFWDAAVNKEKGDILDEFPCPHCDDIQTKRKIERAFTTVFDKDLNRTLSQAKTVPVLINYSYRNKRYEKTPDTDDLSLLKKIDHTDFPYWYPTDELPDGLNTRQPMESHKYTHVHHFHVKSNLAELSAFWEKSRNCVDNRIGKCLMLAASAANLNFSKMRRFRADKKGGGPLAGTLYVSSVITPQNPVQSIKRNVQFISKALGSIKLKSHMIVTQAATSTKLLLKDCSVDYIFTDPPFGANIMYSELNFIWESWLKLHTNSIEEAIENRVQGKSQLAYQEIMTECFKEFFRILKYNHWMTVEFSNTSAAVWNGIQSAIQKAGFIIANVAALDKKQGSHKAVTTPTAVKQDLVISCYKPSISFEQKFNSESSESNIWSFIEEHLSHLPIVMVKHRATTAIIERSPKILYDRVITFYLMKGLPVPIDAVDFQLALRQRYLERDGMIFITEQATKYDEQKRKLGISQQLSLGFDVIYSESDAVLWLKEKLESKHQKYQELQPDFRKANTATRKGEKEFELKILLEENFIELPDGRWRVPDPNEAKDREILRTKALLREFNKYVEELSTAKIKKLKDVRVEALRAGFKSCWEKKDFGTIVQIGEKIPQNILMEDEQLLMFFDIAKDRM